MHLSTCLPMGIEIVPPWSTSIFFLKSFVLTSCGMQSTLRLCEFDMHSNVMSPVTLRIYKPDAWVLHTRIIDQSKADIFIKPRIMYLINSVSILTFNIPLFNFSLSTCCSRIIITVSSQKSIFCWWKKPGSDWQT